MGIGFAVAAAFAIVAAVIVKRWLPSNRPPAAAVLKPKSAPPRVVAGARAR
jgi:hypothetical protein